MPSYNKSFNFRNGVQVDDDNFIVNPNGLVGIGTSIPREFLDVHGTAKITGLVTARNLAVTGVSTFYSDVKIGSGVALYSSTGIVSATAFYGDASKMTGVEQVAVDGWIVNAGNISTTSKVGIGTTLPRSQLDVVGDVKVSGIVTALGFGGYQVLVGTESSAIKTFSVKVASKTSNHRHTGSGSANAYFIDGIESPFLTLLPGKRYRFDQSDASNSGNRLRFYLEADRTTVYDTNVTTSPEGPGTSGSYTQIIVTDTTPVVLHYQSLSSAYMGNAAQFNSNIVNTPYQITTLAGISATTGVVTAYSFSGFGTNIQGINATNINNGTLSNSRLPQSISITGILTASSGIITSLTSTNLNNTGIATLGITSISNLTVGGGVTINSNLTVGGGVTVTSAGIFAPTGIITAPTFVGGLVGIASTARDLTSNARVNIADIQSQTSSIGVSTVSTRLYAESIGVGTNFPSGNIHIRRPGQSRLQVTSDTAEAIIAVGRSTTLIGSNGALIFGNTSGLYPYSNSKTLDIVNYDTGNINNYLQLNSAGTTGSFNWFHGPSASNLMTLTHAGNLGLGITLPTNKLHVVGTSTVTEDSYVGNDLYVNNDLIVKGSFIPNGDISANLTGNVTGNVTGNLTGNVNSTGISTFNDILVSSIGIGTGTARSGLDVLESGAIFGNIGIGTATIADEDTNLYVVGNSEFYGDVSVNGNQVNSLTLATAQNVSGLGTSVNFTGIPSWAKRVTVMFNGVSTSGTSSPLIQIGSGSVSTSGYQSGGRETTVTSGGGGYTFTSGFGLPSAAPANLLYGHSVLTLISSNTWCNSFTMYMIQSGLSFALAGGGVSSSLSGTLDRVRITTVNGTDTFDNGTINIMYE